MSHILVVEDDRDIADLLRRYLEKADHSTEVVSSGSEVLERVRARTPDAVVLDVMLPGLDGLEVCKALRRQPATADIPILMLTARAEEVDRIGGLELGADDYVTKPFSPKEVVARVAALMRRVRRGAGATSDADTALSYGPLTLDSSTHVVLCDGLEASLTAKEFLLLRYLLERRGRVLSRDVLLTDVWGYQYTGGTRTVDVHVRRLREKIPYLAHAIVTVKQFGYKLAEPAPSTS